MTFLPIVARELIEASRRRGTYWIRLGVAGAGVGIGAWIMLVMKDESPASLGMALLVSTASAVYLYCLFAGLFRTADCLSEEKREGTLGLLFLTDLRGYDIVLGKLAASSLNAFYGILAIFPVMAIALLVGGVTLAEFGRIVLVAMNTLFFSLATGMFFSAISRDERRSMLGAFLFVMFFAAGFPILAGICYEWRAYREFHELFFIPSPGFAAVAAFEQTFRAGADKFFYASVIFTHGLSWVLLVAASIIVPRTWQDRALTTAELRRRETLHRFQLGNPEARRKARRRLLEVNPFYWMLARQRMKPLAMWMVLVMTAIVWAIGLKTSPRDWQHDAAYIITAVFLHTVLKLWLTTEACRNFSSQRQSGALELLLSTPITVKELVRGQVRALEWQFAGPAFVVLMADFVFLLAGREHGELVMTWVAGMVVLVLDLATLAYVGMWRGLNSRHANRAAAMTAGQVLMIPWLIYFGLITFIGVSGGFNVGAWTGVTLVILWLIISVVTDLVLIFPARDRLHEHFRRVATEKFRASMSKG